MSCGITDAVQVTEFPDTVNPFLDEELNIVCTATGRPKPTSIQWYLNGTLMDSGDTRITITDVLGDSDDLSISSTLNIQSVSEVDRGVYTCTATNVIPSGTVTDSSSFTLSSKSLGALYSLLLWSFVINVPFSHVVQDPCPVVGTALCYDRIKTLACHLVATLHENEVPLPCK